MSGNVIQSKHNQDACRHSHATINYISWHHHDHILWVKHWIIEKCMSWVGVHDMFGCIFQKKSQCYIYTADIFGKTRKCPLMSIMVKDTLLFSTITRMGHQHIFQLMEYITIIVWSLLRLKIEENADFKHTRC